MLKRYKTFLFSFLITFGLIYILLICVIGGFDFIGTFNTTYLRNQNSDKNLITTRLFEIELDKSWTHVYGGTGICASQFGAFVSYKGIINYSLDEFALDYGELDSIYIYNVSIDTINELLIYTGYNENSSKCGMTIRDIDLNTDITFAMSSTVKKNRNMILTGLEKFQCFVTMNENLIEE